MSGFLFQVRKDSLTRSQQTRYKDNAPDVIDAASRAPVRRWFADSHQTSLHVRRPTHNILDWRSGVCLPVWSLLAGLESACRSGVCLAVWSLLAGLEFDWRSGVCLPMNGAHQSRLASFITFGAREKTAIIFGKAIRAKARSIRLTATSRVMTLAMTIVAT